MDLVRANETLQMLQPPPVVENARHERLGELCAVVIGRADRSIRFGLISHLRADGRRVWIGFPIGDFHRSRDARRLVLDVSAELFENAAGVDFAKHVQASRETTADPQVVNLLQECSLKVASGKSRGGYG